MLHSCTRLFHLRMLSRHVTPPRVVRLAVPGCSLPASSNMRPTIVEHACKHEGKLKLRIYPKKIGKRPVMAPGGTSSSESLTTVTKRGRKSQSELCPCRLSLRWNCWHLMLGLTTIVSPAIIMAQQGLVTVSKFLMSATSQCPDVPKSDCCPWTLAANEFGGRLGCLECEAKMRVCKLTAQL